MPNPLNLKSKMRTTVLKITTMKRQHIIEKLVAAKYAGPELLNSLRNEQLRKLYDSIWPRLLLQMARKQKKDLRVTEEDKAEKAFLNWNRNWSKNWVHPRDQYPLKGPGLVVAIAAPKTGPSETATWVAKSQQDSVVKETMKGTEEYERLRQRVNRSHRRRNRGRRFHRPNELRVQ